MGLLYRNGYFQQYLSNEAAAGSLSELDFYNLPIEPMEIHRWLARARSLELPTTPSSANSGEPTSAIPLYLLDIQHPGKIPPPTGNHQSKLYGGGTELRIKQELVLGIGGVRALEALNIQPTVFHMNEGHSAFLRAGARSVLIAEQSLN